MTARSLRSFTLCLLFVSQTLTTAFAAEGNFSDTGKDPIYVGIAVQEGSRKRTGVTLRLMTEQTAESILMDCVLPLGVRSVTLRCTGLPPIAVSKMVVRHTDTQTIFETPLSGLPSGYDRVSVGKVPPVQAHAAEATWVGFGPAGEWKCELEQADHDWCKGMCGDGYALATEPEIRSNNPFMEPSCKTTCECPSGFKDTRTDPPAVQPAF